MKKIFLIISAVIVIGVGYWLVSPLFITKRVDEKLEDILPKAEINRPAADESQPAESNSPTTTVPPADIPQVYIQPLPPVGPGSESTKPQPTLKLVAQGSFVGLAGHNSAGTAKLLQMENKYYVRFEDDFKVTNGPDLFVHFGKDGEYVGSARLGALKGNVGGQNYEVPSGLNPEDYNEVWVWCRAFAVPFAKAVLQ